MIYILTDIVEVDSYSTSVSSSVCAQLIVTLSARYEHSNALTGHLCPWLCAGLH
jgi:hypothetical protein